MQQLNQILMEIKMSLSGMMKMGYLIFVINQLFENKETLLASVGNIKENLSTKAVNKVIIL